MSATSKKSVLQDIADHAALAAGREMAITSQDIDRIEAVAAAHINSSGVAIDDFNVQVNLTDREVLVELSAEPDTQLAFMTSAVETLSVSSRARLSGRGGNICMIGLSPEAMSTLRLRSRAQITAESCAIYSNSTSASSMWVASTAKVEAELICVAGGYQGGAVQGGNELSDEIEHTMLEDCTPVDDPLAMRVAPTVGECDYYDTRVRRARTLHPGVYCGGLNVDGGTATLTPGEYIITGGPLHIENNGTLEGEHVGFYLSGPAAKMQFDYDSNIAITAPKEGLMTGLLVFSSPYGAAPVEEDRPRRKKRERERNRRTSGVQQADHYIRSDNARRLVGTIYLPNGKLLIDGRRPIADRSEYTVIIADTFELQDGPNLVLRTDYHLSDIPVPQGVGPVSDTMPRLVE